VWGGRFFVVGAVALLITHFVRDGRHDGGGWRDTGPTASAADIDREAERLLRLPGTAEARAWLAEPNRRRRYSSDWGRQAEVQFVNELYDRGAVRVSVADIDPEDGEEVAMHLVVTMPTEPDRRRAVLELINQRLRDEDGARADKGQKYEVLTP
jgi:hypothetical protein